MTDVPPASVPGPLPASSRASSDQTPSKAARSEEQNADRRVVITALVVMIALVLFGVGFGGLFGATNCRQLRPVDLDITSAAVASPVTSSEGIAELLADQGVGRAALTAGEGLLGPVTLAVPVVLDAPLRIGPHRSGVLVTGDGAMLVALEGDVLAGVSFRRAVTVVGDGSAVYALVVGNTITGQVDALRPLLPGVDGFVPGTCVDTSAVGSPLSFLHDARDGNMLGLRTDEDGSDAVLELRDPTRGRVWAPVLELPRAPAGLQGARTSGVIGTDTIVLARRFGTDLTDPTSDDEGHALQAFSRTDGALLWTLGPSDVRAVLPADLAAVATLRLEVAHVGAGRALVTVAPDVAADALLPPPVHGPLGRLGPPDERTLTLEVALADGTILATATGASPVGRDGPERETLRRSLRAVGLDADDAFTQDGHTWVLLGRALARFG